MATRSARQLRSSVTVFVSADIVQAAAFYRDALGFHFDRFWGEPPCFVMLKRDHVELFLTQARAGEAPRPNRSIANGNSWDLYVWVADVRALQEELVSRGVRVLSEPEKTFYNCREIEIEDRDGYRICFSQSDAPAAADT